MSVRGAMCSASSYGRMSLCGRLGGWGVPRAGRWRRMLASPAASQDSRGKVIVSDGMTVTELARSLQTSPRLVMRTLRASGERVQGSSSVLSVEQSELVAVERGFTPSREESRDVFRQPRDPLSLRPRPPVVTVMGHVDHGKTTLLDWLRNTSTAEKEAGGITQHIGAFSVLLSTGEQLTFLDTPGHAAFSAMRARGAGLTDVVVLVVAADDGVMAQTRECLELVGGASVPLVVAINKCDKPGVDTGRVKRQLLQYGVQLEEFGGDVQAVEVSALTGSGVPQLEEALLAQAELSCVLGDPAGPVEGVVIEAHVDRGLGPVASVVVRHGTLRCGAVLVAGRGWGKVRAMFNEHQKPLREAPPSTPVLTVGWREMPAAGEDCLQVSGEAAARDVVQYRAATASRPPALQHTKGEEKGESASVLVKGDVVGTVEVLVGVLQTRQPQGVALSVVHSGVGPVVDSDVETAASTGSVVLAFGVSCTKAVQALARRRGVVILTHNVIYKLLGLLKSHVEGGLPWTEEEEVVGEAVVLRTFQLTGARAASVGGCRVKAGRLLRSATYRLVRDGEVVHEGFLSAMKQGKMNVSEAKKETECGLSFSSGSVEWREGDRVVAFTIHRRPPHLDWDLGF